MMRLTPAQTASLQHWFLSEEPRLLIGAHVIAAGCGECWVDRRPAPHALLAETGGNYLLLGDAQPLTPDDLRPLVKEYPRARPRAKLDYVAGQPRQPGHCPQTRLPGATPHSGVCRRHRDSSVILAL